MYHRVVPQTASCESSRMFNFVNSVFVVYLFYVAKICGNESVG